ILWLQMACPAAKLPLVLRPDLVVMTPFVAEPLGRTAGIVGPRGVRGRALASRSAHLVPAIRIDTPNGGLSNGGSPRSAEKIQYRMRFKRLKLIFASLSSLMPASPIARRASHIGANRRKLK